MKRIKKNILLYSVIFYNSMEINWFNRVIKTNGIIKKQNKSELNKDVLYFLNDWLFNQSIIIISNVRIIFQK